MFFSLTASLLLIAAVVLLLDLNPERITDDIMHIVSPKQTLRDKVRILQGKKKSRRIATGLKYIGEALKATGKGKQFTLICALSVALFIGGGMLAFLMDNPFFLPVTSIALALLPFLYAKNTIGYYEKHINEEMETALSIITSSYIRTDDIIGAVSENFIYLKPPIRDIFKAFLGEATTISSDIKSSIRTLKSKIDNDIFAEWCDTLIACQNDRTLKDTLLPIVGKLTDVRIVNNELRTMLTEPKKEYWMMVALLVGNIPLLYMLNKDWFGTLMHTLPGKIVIAVCGVVILVTALLMTKYTKPIEFKR